jgi:pimeloyl-ACP methyl ester carboxylesterase|tara:strand:+ start:1373 stop:2233 length:861 start_codon:yes stop_codon:yes gene_type:complete
MLRFFKKTAKIVGAIILVLMTVCLILIHVFFKPKSDADIYEIFQEFDAIVQIDTKYIQNKKIRIISTQKELDTTLPNIVFVHGSPGSAMDFKRYLLDKDLNKRANLISFDRVGYNKDNIGDIQTISTEAQILNSLISELDIPHTILVGYSYGGPVALASKKQYKKIVLCAPAIYSEVEPMFWFLNLYRWKVTRWLIPEFLKAASKEKLQHKEDLKTLEKKWVENSSNILSIHGDTDRIVPYENSLFLEEQFSRDQFELITLEKASHDLIWSRFDQIKKELIKVLDD